jgi:hypothetical protein
MRSVIWHYAMKALLALFKTACLIILFFVSISLPAIWSLGKVMWHMQHPIEFDRNVWISENSGQNENRYIRLKMAAMLKEEAVLIGKTKSEIKEKLGEEMKKAPIKGFVYWLSPQFLDSMWLMFEFDKKDRVTKVHIVSD